MQTTLFMKQNNKLLWLLSSESEQNYVFETVY